MNKCMADRALDQCDDKSTDVVPNVNCGLSFNAGSLIGRFNDLHDSTYKRQPVPIVVGTVETWLYNDLPDTCLNVHKCTTLRLDRPCKGGGVLLLINSNFNIISSKCVSFGPIQVLLCDVAHIIDTFALTRFVCVYHLPSCDMASALSFLTALETVIAPLKANFPVLVMGNFILTKIDRNAKCTIINHTYADRQLLSTSQRTHLLQQVSSPTHYANLTDLVFISKYKVITNTLVDMPFSTSDHNTVSFDLSTPVRLLSSLIQLKTRSTLDFSKIDHEGLTSDLLTTNWRSHFSLSDHIDVAWDNFSTYLISLIIKYIPTKRIHCSHRVASLLANNMR